MEETKAEAARARFRATFSGDFDLGVGRGSRTHEMGATVSARRSVALARRYRYVATVKTPGNHRTQHDRGSVDLSSLAAVRSTLWLTRPSQSQ